LPVFLWGKDLIGGRANRERYDAEIEELTRNLTKDGQQVSSPLVAD